MHTQSFPLPTGSACRWAAYQAMRLRDEGFGLAVVDAVQPLFYRFASTGEHCHLEQAQRLLEGER